MAFSMDHAVIAVSDLERAIASYTELGFSVLRGGEHPRRGSINALIVFEDGTYIELISFPRPVPGFRWWNILQEAGPGFVDFAILPSNMRTDVEEARMRGFAAGGIEAGGRVTPLGERSEWETVRSPTSDVPFLCGDITPRRLRVPEGDVRKHKNGALGIAAVSVAVSDLATSAARYRALLGSEPVAYDGGELKASFYCEPAYIKLSQPTPGSDLTLHLEKRGEGPFSLSLRGLRDQVHFDDAPPECPGLA